MGIELFLVDLRLVKDIRKYSSEFDRATQTGKLDHSLCFSVHYGQEFRLNSLLLSGL